MSEREQAPGGERTVGAGVTPRKFVDYYAEQSVSAETMERFDLIRQAVLRIRRRRNQGLRGLRVGDVGCNAGTQCRIWARDGHRVHGVDISPELVELGQERSANEGLSIDFQIGEAAKLPWEDGILDVCLVPELLEHVPDWIPCIDEFVRTLKPGGTLYISTTNRLCPKQQEFDLPLYSWYPSRLKRHYERVSVTTRPELVAHAKFPAVNWFTFYEIRDALTERDMESQDRFDIMDLDGKGRIGKMAVNLIRRNSAARVLGHMLTPYTVVVASKKA